MLCGKLSGSRRRASFVLEEEVLLLFLLLRRGVVGFGIVFVGGLRRGSTGHFLRQGHGLGPDLRDRSF